MLIEEHKGINSLKSKWDYLYKQSESVNSPLQSFIPNKNYFTVFHLGYHRCLLSPRFIYAKDDYSEVIFPYILDKRKKTISEFAPLDYFDVIYSGSFDIVRKVIQWIKDKYPKYQLLFNRVNQSAALFNLTNSVIRTEECVAIDLSGGKYEEYYLSLSKHQRQNLRTAYNKTNKEGKKIALEIVDNRFLTRELKRVLQSLYEDRESRIDSSLSTIKLIYRRITKPVFKIMTSIESGKFFVLKINDMPAAVMAGFYSKQRDSFIVPVLFSNNEMLRYSPGILLINEVIKQMIEENVKILDLARGTEPYKYMMGGETHLNYSILL